MHLFHKQVEEPHRVRMNNYNLLHTVENCVMGDETNLGRTVAPVHLNKSKSKIDIPIEAGFIVKFTARSCKM